MSTFGTAQTSVGRSSGTPANNTQPDPVTRPTGPGGSALQKNDVIVLVVAVGTASAADAGASASGFTQRAAATDQGSPGAGIVVLTKTLTADNPGLTEPSSYAVTVTGMNSANKALVVAFVVRGLNVSQLGAVTWVSAVVGSSSANRGPVSLTLSGSGKLWRLLTIAADRTGGTFTADAGDTEIADWNAVSSPNTAVAVYSPTADVGPGTYTRTPVSSASSSVGVVLIGAFEIAVDPPVPGSVVTGGFVEDDSDPAVGGALTASAFSTTPAVPWVADYTNKRFAVKQGDDPVSFSYTITEAGGSSATVSGSVGPLVPAADVSGQMESLVMVGGVLT